MSLAPTHSTRRAPVLAQLELSKAELTHCKYLYDLYSKVAVMRAHGLKLPIPATDWRRIIQGVWDGWRDCWVVRQGPLIVGHVGLQDRSEIDKRADIVITVDPARQKRGIGRVALERVIRLCDQELEIETLIARVRDDNEAARALFGNFRFVETGRIPQFYRDASGATAQVILVRTTSSTEVPVSGAIKKGARRR